MADREIRKSKFHTIETNEDDLNRKIRKHRLKRVKIVSLIIVIAILITAGVMIMLRFRSYRNFNVLVSKERSDTVADQYKPYNGGMIQYSNDGATYTNAAGETIWNKTYEMQSPIVDICEQYAAFAEKGGTQIYVLNQEGQQGEIKTTMKIKAIQVANQGTVAALMEKDGINYVELYDKSGKNLAGGQIRVENTGYPLGIALSNDAIKLAITMLDVNEGNLKSLIAFYNFGSVGQNEIDHMVGSYTYDDVVVPEIEFVSNDCMLAFGDSKVMIFEGTQKPTLSKEIDIKTDVKSVFYNKNYFGIVSNNDDKDNTRHMDIYETKGSKKLSKDFALDYDSIEFLDNNEICIRNNTNCLIYNTYGVKRFAYKFDTPLYKVLSDGALGNYTFILEGTMEKVRLK